MSFKLLIIEFFFGTFIVTVLAVMFYALYKEVYVPKWQKVYNFVHSYYQYNAEEGIQSNKEEIHKLLMKMYKFNDIMAWRILGAYEDGDTLWFKTAIK